MNEAKLLPPRFKKNDSRFWSIFVMASLLHASCRYPVSVAYSMIPSETPLSQRRMKSQTASISAAQPLLLAVSTVRKF
jgi:hypothetical protein